MTRRTIIILFSVCGFLALIGLGGFVLLERLSKHFDEVQAETIAWMIEETKVNAPANAVLVDFYDGIEIGKLAKYQLTPNEAEKFIKTNGLTPIHDNSAETLLIMDVEKNWKASRLKGSKDFYQLENCKTGIAWKLLLERKSGLLWFEVLHADYSGDLPPCDKKEKTLHNKS